MPRELKLNRIVIRLTGAGLLYIGFTLALGLVAVNANNNLLYLTVAGLLSLLALSGFLGYANIRHLEASIRPPEEIYAGRPVTAALELWNRKGRLPSFLIAVGAGETRDVLLEIPPGGSAGLQVQLLFSRRGLCPLDEILLTSVFPFGLIRRGGSFDPGLTCLVYPRPQAVSWSLLEEAERVGEETSLPRAGVGGDYRGIRNYLPGDSISRIHWKGWLRHRRLMTKEFEAEGGPPVIFAYEAMPGPDHEDRLGQLTWLVRTELRRGRAVGLTLPDATFPPAVGAAHRKKLLTALALFGDGHARP